MKYLILLIVSSCMALSPANEPDERLIIIQMSNDQYEMIDQGGFQAAADHMEKDSVIFLHVVGLKAQVVRKKDLRVISGLIYKNKHDNYK